MRRDIIFLIISFFLFTALPVYPNDVRVMMIEAQKQKRKELLEKAKAEKQKAIREAEETRKRILNDKRALEDAINTLKRENRRLKKQRDNLRKDIEKLIEKEQKLAKRRAEEEEDIRELIALTRTNAKDLKGLLDRSMQSGFLKGREADLKPIMNKLEFPGIEDIKNMVDILFQEIRLSGQVRLIKDADFIDRSGKEAKGDILVIGDFEAIYRSRKETGFLLYSESSHRFFALSKPPPHHMIKELNSYMDGRSDDVPIDISKGGALRQLIYKLSLIEEIPKGGPIVIPILFIGAIAFVLIIERAVYLIVKDHNMEALINTFMLYLSKGEWQRCIEICKKESKRPIFKVLFSGIRGKDMPREELENLLEEAILSEIPGIERFLSTINILAQISPLLGLLGTVTGIINTFHTITLYGTGDPRMMSSGISEALVTTMLGLMVAIPVMFCHTLLSTKVENMISKMEKSALSFVNILFKEKGDEGNPS